MQAVKIHEAALSKMIGARGGLKDLGCSGLHLWISWYTLTRLILILFPPVIDVLTLIIC